MYSSLSNRSARAHAFAGFACLALAMGVGRFAFTPLLPAMQSEHGVTIAGGAWLATANYVGYFVGALLAYSARARASMAIRSALLTIAAATLAMGVTDSFVTWLVLRAAAGVASAFLLIHVSAWTLAHIGCHVTLRACVFSGVGAGIFAVGMICFGLARSGEASAESWIVLGIASLAVSALIWRTFDDAAGAPAHAAPAPDQPSIRRRLIGAYAAAGFGYIVPATFLPVLATADAADPIAITLAWPAFGVAAFCSTFLAATVGRGGSPLRLWRSAQALMALGVAVPAFTPTLAGVMFSGVCVGGTFMVVTMAAMQAGRQYGGPDPRRLLAALTAAFAAGQLAGPLAVPLFVDAEGHFSALLLAAALVLTAGMLLLPSSHRTGMVPIAEKGDLT